MTLKRVTDIVGSFLLVVLLLPLLTMAAVLVAIDDGWPLIYRRRVVGPRGEFDAYKFRTMRRDADRILAENSQLRMEFERQFKLKNDPRVTRLGSILRKFSLDELPQLLNVVKGDMSLVGPRMICKQELAKYGPHQELLLTVKPGLTGYWQVNGRQTVDYEERVRMDLYYVEHRSFRLDLKILAKTPFTVLKREGAY